MNNVIRNTEKHANRLINLLYSLNKFELEFLFLVTGNIKIDLKSENIFYKHRSA